MLVTSFLAMANAKEGTTFGEVFEDVVRALPDYKPKA